MKQVRQVIGIRVDDLVYDKVLAQTSDPVWNQVWDHLFDPVDSQVWNQARSQVWWHLDSIILPEDW